MGGAVIDFDRDGDLDWFVTSIHKTERRSGREPTGNRLYLNVGGEDRFVDVSSLAGVREGGWGWGACWADFDNDGHPDLFHTNGWFDVAPPGGPYGGGSEFTEFVADPSRLFMSNGDGTFSERSAALGIDHSGQGRGVVCADYDGDGRVDIFIANHGAAPTVYRNAFDNANHWLAIDLAGQFANPRAIGARVIVHTASGSQTQEVRLGTGYLSQGPATLHFGLGPHDMASAVEVRWPGPGRQVSRLEIVRPDRRLTIRQPQPEGVLLSVVRGSGGRTPRRGRDGPHRGGGGATSLPLQPLEQRRRRRLRRRPVGSNDVHHPRKYRDRLRQLPARAAAVGPGRFGRAPVDRGAAAGRPGGLRPTDGARAQSVPSLGRHV